MKRENHPVDDFIKEALQEYKVIPSEEGKQRFLKEAETIQMTWKRSRWRWILFWTGLVVIGTGALYIWSESSQEFNGKVSSIPASALPEVDIATPSSSPAIPSSFREDSPGLVSSPSLAAVSPALQAMITIPNETPSASEPADSSLTPLIYSFEKDPLFDPSPDTLIQATQDLPGKDSLVDHLTAPLPDKLKKRKSSSDWKFATSVYYLPEWMFNTLEGDKYVSNFGLEQSFRYGRYSLRTGIGLSITKGTNELVVEFNDYLGSYEQLDSMSFRWDERHYNLIPTYYLSNQDVWDSLLRLDYPKVIKRYTYLQVPFILGYDVIQKRGFSLGFRAGPVLSILLNSATLSGDYDQGKNRIIRINQVTPDRIQTNWQVQGGINLSLHLSGKFDVEIEPTIKYYFNSVYEKSDALKKPWSLGLRAAFTIQYK